MKKRIISILLLLSVSLSTFVGCDVIFEEITKHFPIDDFGNSVAVPKDFYYVIPDANSFDKLELSDCAVTSTVITEIWRETSGLGYAVKLNTVGYAPNFVIVVGVSCDGVVTGATCITSNETNGVENSYGENFIGKNLDGAKNVDLVANSTMTTKAYRSAVVDAINAVLIIEGKAQINNVGNKIGNLCPGNALSLVNSDSKINITDFRGKKVIINFWGTWCGPCMAEMPDFDRVADEYADDVVVIAIHSVSGKENAPQYIEDNFADSKIYFAYDTSLSATLDMYYAILGGTSSYPRTIVLDENGVITFIHEGKMSYEQIVDTIS